MMIIMNTVLTFKNMMLPPCILWHLVVRYVHWTFNSQEHIVHRYIIRCIGIPIYCDLSPSSVGCKAVGCFYITGNWLEIDGIKDPAILKRSLDFICPIVSPPKTSFVPGAQSRSVCATAKS